MGFAGRPGTELDDDLGANETGFLEQRLVRDIEPIRIRAYPCCEAGAGETLRDDGAGLVPDPFGETGANGARPSLLLAARGRKRLVARTENQIRREGAYVVGDVDIFGKPTDRVPHLRERGAALEGQVLGERSIEQNTECGHDPDILLE